MTAGARDGAKDKEGLGAVGRNFAKKQKRI